MRFLKCWGKDRLVRLWRPMIIKQTRWLLLNLFEIRKGETINWCVSLHSQGIWYRTFFSLKTISNLSNYVPIPRNGDIWLCTSLFPSVCPSIVVNFVWLIFGEGLDIGREVGYDKLKTLFGIQVIMSKVMVTLNIKRLSNWELENALTKSSHTLKGCVLLPVGDPIIYWGSQVKDQGQCEKFVWLTFPILGR